MGLKDRLLNSVFGKEARQMQEHVKIGHEKVQEAIDRKNALRERIENMPAYQMAPETQQQLEMLQEKSGEMITGAEEATDIARMQAGMVEAPGQGQAREDIRQSTAAQAQAMGQMGGAGFLGGITKLGLQEDQAYADLAQSNILYKDQAEQNLTGALQTEAGIRTQAAGLEAQGLQIKAGEREKEYQSELNRFSTGLQYDIGDLAMRQQNKIAKQNRPRILGIF